jgi:hypothetical protein
MRSTILAVSVVVMWLVGFSASYANVADEPLPMTRQQIEEQISKALPRGVSRERVIAFLDAHHVENSSSASAAPPNQVLAIYRDIRGSTPVVKKAVQVVFRFRDDALESYSVTEKLTGP